MATGDDHTSQRGEPAPALTVEGLRRAVQALKAQSERMPSPEHPFVVHLGGRVWKYDGRGWFDAGPMPILPMMGERSMVNILEDPFGTVMRLHRRAAQDMLSRSGGR